MEFEIKTENPMYALTSIIVRAIFLRSFNGGLK